MPRLDIYGYIALFTGLFMFYVLELYMLGFFFQGMALGFFGKSICNQIRDKLKDK